MKSKREWVAELTGNRPDDFYPAELPEMEELIDRIQRDALGLPPSGRACPILDRVAEVMRGGPTSDNPVVPTEGDAPEGPQG